MSDFTIKKATRQGIKPLIDLYSESGCGKTYSSLLLARGFVGPTGKIVLVDSESGRGSLYADVLPGGYEVLQLDPPFSPDRYIKAMEVVERSGASIGIIDSGSHEWEGVGGVLDMASDNEERSKRAGLHNWKQPKFEHAKFVAALQRSTIPWIVCLRAKYKTRQTKINGKTEIVKDDCTSPIQAEDFIFEATCHAEILPDHSVRLTKCSHPGLRDCFPKTGPITTQHGELLARWCSTPQGPGTAVSSTAGQSDRLPAADADLKRLKKKLWDTTKPKHGGIMAALEQWLIDESIIGDTETLESYGTVERMTALIEKVEGKLSK